jgi:tetratricopeptide (TPR) repeat protein
MGRFGDGLGNMSILKWWWITVLPIALLVGLQACGPSAPDSEPLVFDKTYLNHAPEAQYVGKEACRACHAEQYDTYVKSEMGRSWKPAEWMHSAAKWEGIQPVHDPHTNLSYLPFRRGNDLFVKEFRLQGKDTVHQRIEKLSFIVGSGQHTNSHLIEENGYLYQAPVTWYAQDGKWDLPPGFENGQNSRFGRSIELECITCHNAMPTYVPGSDNRFLSIPDGIDCERCHGPGSIHVEAKKEGDQTHLVDGIDYTIVHPGKLPVELQFDICQRCHLQGTAVPVEGKSFLDFRPGMKLSETINTFIPRYRDSLNQFIMASHPDRLRMSDCFLTTQNNPAFPKAMTCITCHNPHLSIELQGPEHYRNVCESCHSLKKDNFCSLNSDLRNAKQNDCAGCHMPRSGSTDIPHVRITDHYIRIPDATGKRLSADEKKAVTDFVKLSCRTQENPDDLLMASGYLAQYEQFSNLPWLLDSAQKHLGRARIKQGEQATLKPTVRLHYLKRDYPSLAALGKKLQPNEIGDAWTAYRIAEGLQSTGDAPKALDWFRKAVSLAPQHLKFNEKLAAALIGSEQVAEGMKILESMVKAYSRDPSILNNRGYGHVLQGNMKLAESDFLEALRLNPDNATAMANLASLYLNTNRSAKAKPLVNSLLAKDPTNPGYLRLKAATEL